MRLVENRLAKEYNSNAMQHKHTPEGTVFDNNQQKEITSMARQLSWYRIGFFLLLLVLIFSLIGNAYLFFYLNQVAGIQLDRSPGIRSTDNGLQPPEDDDEMDDMMENPEEVATDEADAPAEEPSPQSNASETQVQTEFISEPYQLSFLYPETWETRQESEIFSEQGSVIQIYTQGADDQGQELITDGASFTVMRPVETDQELEEWIQQNYNTSDIPREGTPVDIQAETIGQTSYTVARSCQDQDDQEICIDRYHTKTNSRIYGFAMQIAGSNQDIYRQQIMTIIESVQLNAGQ